jgi:hypothetical protein
VKETLWHRFFRGVRRLRQRPDWPSFAGPDWPDHIMHVVVSDRLHSKQGRSIARWTLPGEGRELVVFLKRHHRLPWWQGLLATCWPGGNWSPAMAEWEHLSWAQAQGLPVPSPTAAGEFIGPGGRLRSFLAVEELTDMLPLHQAVPLASRNLEARTFSLWKKGLIAELVRLIRSLHDRCWFHKDLYLCHFYIEEEDTHCLPSWTGRVKMIDLHRLGRHPWTWPWWQAKDLSQFLYSSRVSGITARDRVWFWHLYQGQKKRGLAERLLRRLILLKAWNYERHNRKRRAATMVNNEKKNNHG